MTVPASTNTQTYNGDNSTVAFAFNQLFYANGDLSVTVGGVAQVLDTDYTVTGAGNDAGGTVTFVVAPPTGTANVIIQRIVSYTQETDFEDFDGNPADVTEQQFDLVVMQTQQLAEQTARTILAPITTALASNTITGTINSTKQPLVISTAGPEVATFASLSSSLDVTLTSETSGDLLTYNGASWINTATIPTANLEDGAVTNAKIADSTLTVAKLANGTDGELITWNSLGVADTIAAGTAGHVLTSNGPGSKATFQAPSTTTSSGVIDFASDLAAIDDSLTTTAHGLGGAPDLIKIYLTCIATELNYSVNDRLDLVSSMTGDTNPIQYYIQYDATNIILIAGELRFILPDKATPSTASSLTLAKWKLSFEAFIFS